MVELTVPWEDSMEVAFKREKGKYAELAAACSQAGWRAFTFLVEVGSRGYTGASAQHLFKTLGTRDTKPPLQAECRRGRAGQLLAVASQEGQNVGEAGIFGSMETSLSLLHHPEMWE